MCPGRGRGMTTNLALWEVDPFYAAAEDVQDSADRLESAYRNWVHSRGLVKDAPTDAVAVIGDEARQRELLTALHTVKWQLEEFEKAVTVGTYVSEGAAVRHRQFVQAIRAQLEGVEQASPNSHELDSAPLASQCEEDHNFLADFLLGSRVSQDELGDAHIHPLGEDGKLVYKLPDTTSAVSELTRLACSSSVESGESSEDFARDTQVHDGSPRINGCDDHILLVHEERLPHVGFRRSSSMSSGMEVQRGENNSLCNPRHTDSFGSGFKWWGLCNGQRHNGRKLLSTNSGFKRWKDGDAIILPECEDGLPPVVTSSLRSNFFGDLELGKSGCWLLGNHRKGSLNSYSVEKRVQQPQSLLPFGRLAQIASAMLIILGLVGVYFWFLSTFVQHKYTVAPGDFPN